ncbi:MAG: hypothetical protein KGI08_05145 [Thaumarchaeota archaeon]|nr:hypothetical protein [Nitrososphaerota archaeon]
MTQEMQMQLDVECDKKRDQEICTTFAFISCHPEKMLHYEPDISMCSAGTRI